MSAQSQNGAFRSVFASGNPVAGPFRRAISDRAILFPIPDYRLPSNLCAAIANVASSQCYLTFVGALVKARTGPLSTTLVDLDDYDDYHSLSTPRLPQALVAIDGSWGGLFADDGFGLLGGVRGFLAALRVADPALDFEKAEALFRAEFAGDRERLGSANWVDRVLAHVHG